ncbi:hypothetical protein JTB14_004593 [Gonioctena quinquepunctata]|nr:hypothetical protein JTB14_004593 [Gonioctena quinquepunctata]
MEEAKQMDLLPNSPKWDSYVELLIRKLKLNTYNILLSETNSIGLSQARQDDHIAHWLLSLSYCRTHELRYCFIRWELQWFTMLYSRMAERDLNEFLVECDFIYAPMSSREKEILKDKLISCRHLTEDKFGTTPYYKANFTEIIQLVASKNVFLLKGIAYFPESDIINCIKNRLRAQFSVQLRWINKMLPVVADNRIEFLLQNILPFNPMKHHPLVIRNITLENLEEIASNHYPLCMKTVHAALRKEHHLKYDSKMQYGIFLKWIGLSYDDAMEFWKNEFTQDMSTELYLRKYLYLFKHQYGMVGGRIQYKPFTCKRIQNYSPGPGHYHGCPFKHWNKENLMERLQDDGLLGHEIHNVGQQVDEGQYQNACTSYFCATHHVIRDDTIHSPNQYTADSFNINRDLDNIIDFFCEDLTSQPDN